MKKTLCCALMIVLMLSLVLSMTSCSVFGGLFHKTFHNVEIMEPSCTASGFYFCTTCGVVWGEYGEALGHSEVVTDRGDHVCTMCAEILYTYTSHHYVDGVCEECGDILHTHSYTARVFEPTCAKQGYTEYTCECNDKYMDNYTDMLPHEYVDEYCKNCGSHRHNYETTEVISEPTCDKDGTAKCICSCGEWIKESISSIGHDFVDGRCTVCYESAHTHSYDTKVIPPNCVSVGYTEHTCSKCGDRYEDAETEVDPDAHTYVNGKCMYCYEQENR